MPAVNRSALVRWRLRSGSGNRWARLSLIVGPVVVVAVLAPIVGLVMLATLAAVYAMLRIAPDAAALATGMHDRRAVVHRLDGWLARQRPGAAGAAAMMIEVDRFRQNAERYDHATHEAILNACAVRLRDSLREADFTARLDGPCFAVALCPARCLDMESAIQLAARLQRVLAEPLSVSGANLYLSVSVGFALPDRLMRPDGEHLLHAATLALAEASRNGPGAVRSYSTAMQARIGNRNGLAREVSRALAAGEVLAFFQPQISTRTGGVTGMEALARWNHPVRGLIPPAEFLPALRQAGMMDRLAACMVTQSLGALRQWDDAGHIVPQVGVNFSTEELRDPRLVDRVAWELDRFGLCAARLGVEVLETVVAGRGDDMVLRNLGALARMGCQVDLDDFGTGHAAITTIRRFAVGRIKIDRSFVSRIDEDAEQQEMVAAILTMADRLRLETLAEGVETAGERAMLARLGCGHVQGFGIARPMPLAEASAWLSSRQGKGAEPFPAGRPTLRAVPAPAAR